MRWAFSVAIAALLVNLAPLPQAQPNRLVRANVFSQFPIGMMARKAGGQRDQKTVQPTSSCPRALPALTAWMLQDLPSYANRIRQRSWSSVYRQANQEWMVSNIILAGQAEFEPLPTQVFGNGPAKFSPELQQVFFTTLERNYPPARLEKPLLSNSYHWLFLTQGKDGWDFVQMITRMGKTVSAQTALPPRDSSDGAIAQGIRLWLRDCQAGTLHSQPPQSTTPVPPSPWRRKSG